MTTKSKGSYYEKKSRELLEKQGYRVERALPRIIWIKGRPISTHHDFYGVGDLIAVRADGFKIISVKYRETRDGGNFKRKELQELPAPPGTKELHIWTKEGNRSVLEIDVY